MRGRDALIRPSATFSPAWRGRRISFQVHE
jgi:hypothetical protein